MLDLHDDVSDQLINKYPGTWLKLYTLKDYANEKQDLLFSEPVKAKPSIIPLIKGMLSQISFQRRLTASLMIGNKANRKRQAYL